MLRRAPLEPEGLQAAVEFGVPRPWCLTETVESLPEPKHLVLVAVVDEARWLRDVHLLLELAIEECQFDIHVVHLPALLCHKCNQQAHGLHSSDGREDFLEVNTLALHIPLGNEARLVLNHSSL